MTFRAITVALGCAVVAASFPVCSFAGGAVPIGWANDGALSSNASPFFADQAGTKRLTAGSINTVTLEGARYVAPLPGKPALDVTNAACNLLITLGSGNLSSVLSNSVRLDAANKVSLCVPNGFKLTIVPTTGLFSGSFLNPATHKTTKFSGALSQEQNIGAGLFLGTNQTGFVAIEPSP
jgi:hypothetical protein